MSRQTIWGELLLVESFIFVFIIGLLPPHWHAVAYSIAYTLLFYTCVLNLKGSNRRKMLMAAAVVIMMEWSAVFFGLAVLNGISKVLNALFFAVIVGLFIRNISRDKKVDGLVVLGSLNGYLLLGILFSVLITLVVQVDPMSFSFSSDGQVEVIDSLYYGFVTISTLGYGDFLPLKPYAKSLAILITISGQLYVAIIIALLVGKYANPKTDEPDG